MGKKSRQFFGAVAVAAFVGSGAALADASVVTTSTASTTGIESASINTRGATSISSSSAENLSTSTITEISGSESKVLGDEKKNAAEVSSNQSDEKKSSSTVMPMLADNTSDTAGSTQSKLSMVTFSFQPSDMQPNTGWDQKVLYSQTESSPQSIYVNSSEPSASTPSSPFQSDPLAGIMDELSFLSEIIIPVFASDGIGEVIPSSSYSLIAMLFSIYLLILLISRKKSFSRYINQLRYSGFIHAPRSDTLRAFNFATPPKWVLSTALSRA